MNVLNKKSGLLGISGGFSSDFRDLNDAAEGGNEDAANAIESKVPTMMPTDCSVRCTPTILPVFAYRGIIIPLLCSYRGGSQGLSSTYEQAHVDLDLLTLASYSSILGIATGGKTMQDMVRVVVDAMGNAPGEIVKGAVEALRTPEKIFLST